MINDVQGSGRVQYPDEKDCWLDDDKLLRCPFCYSPASFEFREYNESDGSGDDGTGWARCQNADCRASIFDNWSDAIIKWNRRVNG